MTRPIKFRALRSDGKGMVYGYYLEIEYCDGKGRKPYIKVDGCSPVEIDPTTLGQYWRTINGVDVYEGDIIESIFKDLNPIRRIVRYNEDESQMAIVNIDNVKYAKYWDIFECPNKAWFKEFEPYMKVIGNIHTNPEMI